MHIDLGIVVKWFILNLWRIAISWFAFRRRIRLSKGNRVEVEGPCIDGTHDSLSVVAVE